jgi:hypothetical protein
MLTNETLRLSRNGLHTKEGIAHNKVQGVSLAIGPKVFLITFKVIDVI